MANEYKGVSSIVPIVFVETMTISTEEDISPYGVAQAIGVVLPFDGSIVGISALHVTATTYDLVLSVELSGSAVFTKTLGLAAASETYARYMPGTYEVTAGEEMTVTAKWASGQTGSEAAGVVQVVVFVQIGSSGT